LIEVIIAASITAGTAAAVALYIFYQGRRPSLEVRRSAPETRFKERIEVQNHGQTTYTYRVRVGNTYLKLETKGNLVNSMMLPPGGAFGVVLDDAYDDLPHEDIIIECTGWLPWSCNAVVIRRRLDAV
jgi:hypothetical protein